jgi:hypothetical protein
MPRLESFHNLREHRGLGASFSPFGTLRRLDLTPLSRRIFAFVRGLVDPIDRQILPDFVGKSWF